MYEKERWTDIVVAIGLALLVCVGLLALEYTAVELQEHSMARPLPRYPLHHRQDFFVKSAWAEEKPLCTCGPRCPTPVAKKWPIPASMVPLK